MNEFECLSIYSEPASLEKVAQQEAEEEEEDSEMMTTEVVIGADGNQQLITKVKPTISAPGERVFKYDIMISYCHADKDLCYKIHKFLVNQGFKIWLDLDNMHGPGRNKQNSFS